MVTGEERALIDRLAKKCRRLEDAAHTSHIFQGLITSADAVYHLRRVGPGRYICTPNGDPKPPPYEVNIEDTLMKPLVSGEETKRYVEPLTNTYLLFPYRTVGRSVVLIDDATMARDYPNAWTFLEKHKECLRFREAKRDRNGEIKRHRNGKAVKAPFDDERWYRFGRPQNLDKQEIRKLVVAQTVPSLRLCYDSTGTKYLNNVRVNGIVATEGEDHLFLLGVLNSPVADFVFRRIAKPKRGGYFEANRQFIAPLPIPPATSQERAAVASGAEALQHGHTRRRDVLKSLSRRLSNSKVSKRPETWLFPHLVTKRDRLADAPRTLGAVEARVWAEERYTLDLKAYHDALGARLTPGTALDAALRNGELLFFADGITAIERIFVDGAEGPFLLAQWKVVASTFVVNERATGKKLADALRTLAPATNAALVEQVISLQIELAACEADIKSGEARMNELVEGLYCLTPAESALVNRANPQPV